MCILDIIIAIIYDELTKNDKPFNTESNNVSKKRCKKDERNGTVSIPKTTNQHNAPMEKDMNANNKSMDPGGGILGITLVNIILEE